MTYIDDINLKIFTKYFLRYSLKVMNINPSKKNNRSRDKVESKYDKGYLK